MPLEVPSTMTVEIVIHVGWPQFRRPASENACPVILRSLVHRTTSQGACDGSDSISGVAERARLARDECRECPGARNGDGDRGLLSDEDDNRDWKRRSNGRWVGPGLRPGEPRNTIALLLGNE